MLITDNQHTFSSLVKRYQTDQIRDEKDEFPDEISSKICPFLNWKLKLSIQKEIKQLLALYIQTQFS